MLVVTLPHCSSSSHILTHEHQHTNFLLQIVLIILKAKINAMICVVGHVTWGIPRFAESIFFNLLFRCPVPGVVHRHEHLTLSTLALFSRIRAEPDRTPDPTSDQLCPGPVRSGATKFISGPVRAGAFSGRLDPVQPSLNRANFSILL